jgi:hypothetical protein
MRRHGVHGRSSLESKVPVGGALANALFHKFSETV